MVYGGYGGFGGYGGYGGYGGLGSTPTTASGIHPPGSAAYDPYGQYGATGQPQKQKSFLKGLFTGTAETFKKMFTTVPGVLATVGAVGLTIATGGAALIPLGALAAGYGVYNSAKGLANEDGQGFTKGLLLGLGGLLALRFAPNKIAVGGRTFLLGGNDAKSLGLSGRVKALWGGNKFVASNGDKLNVYSMSTNKVLSQFRPDSASLQHLDDLKRKGSAVWNTPQDAKDALTAGAKVPEGTKAFLAKDQAKAKRLKELNLKLEKQQLDGQPTETLEAEIARLSAKRAERFDEIKAGTYGAANTPPAQVAAPSTPLTPSTEGTSSEKPTGWRRIWPFGNKRGVTEVAPQSQPGAATVAVASHGAPLGATGEVHSAGAVIHDTQMTPSISPSTLSRASSLSSLPPGEPVSSPILSRVNSNESLNAAATAAVASAAANPAPAAVQPQAGATFGSNAAVGASEGASLNGPALGGNPFAEHPPVTSADHAARTTGQALNGNTASEGWATDWESITQNNRSATVNTPSQRAAQPSSDGFDPAIETRGTTVPVVSQAGDNQLQPSRANNPDALLPPDKYESSASVEPFQRGGGQAEQAKPLGWFKQIGQKFRSVFGSTQELPRTEDPDKAFRFQRSD